MANPPLFQNFRQYVRSISAPWLLGEKSGGFVGVTLSLTSDLAASGLRYALRMPWLRDSESPDDVLPLIGQERRMPAYPAEPLASYRQRLWNAWETYRFGGDENSITSELATAGYPGAEIRFYPGAPGPNGEPSYRTQFWVWFPFGSHPVAGTNLVWDTFTWDDGSLWDLQGATAEFFATIRGIVRKWKPVQWICRSFQFELAGAEWDAFNWDDGTVWAGIVDVQF